jgi:hypothetical protein
MWPSFNRAPADQLAEAPISQGSGQDASSSAGQSGDKGTVDGSDSTTGEIEVAPTPEAGIVDDGAAASAANPATPTPAASPKAAKDPSEKILAGPGLGSIMNSDSKSTVFVLDQSYTAVGDNGLTAKFTFNPTTDEIFSRVVVEITLKDKVFDFRPINPVLIQGKNPEGLDIFMFVGQAPYLFDEFGQKWSETDAKDATFKLEVIMERNGIDVKEIRLALFSAN